MAKGWIHTVYRRESDRWVNHVEGEGPLTPAHASKDEAVDRGRALAEERRTQHVVHRMDGTILRRRSYEADAA